MTDLPEWILERTSINPSHEVQEREVARIFVESDRPYLTRRQVQSKLEGNPSKGTVIDRLSGLCEVEVLAADELEGGNIYWLENEKLNWPIPPDVDVEPISDEMTVSEFFNSSAVTWSGIGIGVILVSSLFLWVGASYSAVGSSVLGITATDLILAGFLLIFTGWMIIVISAFLWFRNPPAVEDRG